MNMSYEAVTARLTEKGYYLHHTATCGGYRSRRRKDVEFDVYDGMFGKGYRLYRPNWRSTRFSFVEYWIKGA